MNINLDSNLLEAFNQLDKLYEDVNKEASKKFWADAREKKIDERAFHTAFDEELAALGLSDIFDKKGRLAHKGVYGRIKEAADANPDSWAVKAALKLWVLEYKDNANYQIDIENRLKWQEEEKRKAEAEAKAKAEREQKEKEFLATAIAKLDQKDKDYFETLTGKPLEQDCTIVELTGRRGRWLNVASCNWNWQITQQETFTLDALLKIFEKIFPDIIDKVEHKIKGKAGDAFDIFKALTSYKFYAYAKLLGESGTIYDVSISYTGNVSVTSKENKAIKYLSDITEPYKVIFTCVTHSDGNRSTYRNSVSTSCYSWDSFEAAKLTGYIPYIGHSDYEWSYVDTQKVTNPSSEAFSKMDNIDTWAYQVSTELATD